MASATSTDISDIVLVNLEPELVCFICMEILYQPLCLLDCLHSFCGACLKQWFCFQYNKANSSNSSTSTSNPYTCPTCRGSVKGTTPNSLVNTWLDKFLTANPGRGRSEEFKLEQEQIYKPGDDILPKVEGRRRERRSRRDEDAVEARERRMIAEAQERSLRELRGTSSTTPNSLQPPYSHRDRRTRSHDSGERRDRQRDSERPAQRQGQRVQNVQDSRRRQENLDVERERRESLTLSVPTSSPRHPEAVEARQRQQTVAHQPSLTSLISSSESGAGSNDSEALMDPIMQELLAEGLLTGINVDVLTEREQEVLVDSVLRAYRDRMRERNHRNNPSTIERPAAPELPGTTSSNNLQVNDARRHQREESSSSRQRRADTAPVRARDGSTGRNARPARPQPGDSNNSLPPQSSVILTHRRRASSQGQHDTAPRTTSRNSSPTRRSNDSRSRSSVTFSNTIEPQNDISTDRAPGTNDTQRYAAALGSPGLLTPPVVGGDGSASLATAQGTLTRPQNEPMISQNSTTDRRTTAESSESRESRESRPTARSAPQPVISTRRASGLHDEPSISCFRCHRADVQYEVYKHCEKCKLDLCLQCYRTGRGCQHWYGFGHAAIPQFESLQPASYESMELPHALILGRQYQRPAQTTIIKSKMAKDGLTVIPVQTTSDPKDRFLEGRFCDRCSTFANSCFWSCDYCNYGEWGFCKKCVDTHHCCTHPLLPSAHRSSVPITATSRPAVHNSNPTASDLLANSLQPSPIPSQPASATSGVSDLAGPLPDYINLVINTQCDICSQPIPPTSLRFHCPSHLTPTAEIPDACGDYDVCTTCYQNLVRTNRIRRDDGSAGWRKCPSGHRMIITKFTEADNEGGQRRVVVNDLVGGWKSPEEAMREWQETRKEHGSGSDSPTTPDGPSARRAARGRTGSWGADPSSPTTASPFNSSLRFPPDGGTGLRGVSWLSYFPDDAGPLDLVFPVGAEFRELKIHEEYPDWYGGVYAGDRGLIPVSWVRTDSLERG